MNIFDWFNPRRPTGVLLLLLPAIVAWTALYWLADLLLPLIGVWTHLALPVGVIVLLAIALQMADTRRQ